MPKKIAPLEEVCEIDMNDEEIVDDPAEASLDRLVVLLNWTLLSVSPSCRSSVHVQSSR
jgi:hypothetical protein